MLLEEGGLGTVLQVPTERACVVQGGWGIAIYWLDIRIEGRMNVITDSVRRHVFNSSEEINTSLIKRYNAGWEKGPDSSLTIQLLDQRKMKIGKKMTILSTNWSNS